MSKSILAAAAAIVLASCTPPPVPPPRFTPNPPYPPQPLDPYDQTTDPYGQAADPAAPTPSAPQPEAPQTPGTYPNAQRTADPNQVISPYAPYNIIDVEGFRSGQLARDPSNQKIFRVP